MPAGAQLLPGHASAPTADQTARWEALGATIADIAIVVENVFDLSNPEEDKRVYRIANQLHIKTRPEVVANILLIRSGDRFDQRLLEESERLLRGNIFISDAYVQVVNYDASRNTVDIEARIRDTWSFTPELSFGRSGGQNEYGLALDESNLLGFGKDIAFSYDSNIDRIERYIRYVDPNLRGGRTRLDVTFANNSDGDRYRLLARRPFYALDARWAVGAELIDEKRIDPIYDLGELVDEFSRARNFLEVSGGWSRGLINGRTLRWLAGATYDQHQFSPTVDVPVPMLLPPDRKLVYPWAGFQLFVDDFRELTQFNTMGRIEDIPFGLNLRLRLGRASAGFGADRDAWLLNIDASRGWDLGYNRFVFTDFSAHARRENLGLRNVWLNTRARYFQRNFDYRHLFSVNLETLLSERLDPDQQVLLGGDNGLRGYPLRYQAGERRAVLNVEQRFFMNWFPFRLFQVGAAMFFDAGRTWGQDPRATPSRGVLYDVGVGLRLASPRSSGRSVIHIDLAFPLNRDSTIDAVQLLIETKSSF